MAMLAKLDLETLSTHIQAGNTGSALTALENANRRLTEELANVWTQHKVSVRFSCDPRGEAPFMIHFEDPATNEQFRAEERSEGLRWFVTLYAFLKGAHRDLSVPPVLLVDEVESHLHYDAQADVVREMMAQTLTANVIYTTHSAGSLPPNLARVRIIEAEDSYSVIRNKFWSRCDGRISSVIMSMGATNFAFTRSRSAAVTEGPSDFLLLPTVFEEIDDDYNEQAIQVVPGLSWVAKSDIHELDREAGSVAYIIDNDAGGQDLRDLLIKGGVDAGRIIKLPDPVKDAEDFVDPQALMTAISSLDNSVAISLSEIPEVGRGHWLNGWLADNLPTRTKVDVAERVIQQNPKIHDPKHVVQIQQLLASVREITN